MGLCGAAYLGLFCCEGAWTPRTLQEGGAGRCGVGGQWWRETPTHQGLPPTPAGQEAFGCWHLLCPVALVKINEGGKWAAAGMREILRVALSTHSQISQANPSLSMQIPAPSPRTAGDTGATHAPGDQTLAARKPSTRLPRATVGAAVLLSPQAGQALPAAPLSAASSVAPLAGALCLSPLVALLPFRACRALQARPG